MPFAKRRIRLRIAPLRVVEFHAEEHELRLAHLADSSTREIAPRHGLQRRRDLILRPPRATRGSVFHLLLEALASEGVGACATLAPALVHLDDADGVLLGEGGRERAGRVPVAAIFVLVQQRVQELRPLLQLGASVLHEIPRERNLEGGGGEFEIDEDVVEGRVDAAVEMDEPVLELEAAAHARLERALDVAALLGMTHLVVHLLQLAEDLEVLDVRDGELGEAAGVHRGPGSAGAFGSFGSGGGRGGSGGASGSGGGAGSTRGISPSSWSSIASMHSRHCTSKVLKDGKGGGGGQDRDGTHATGWAPD